MTFQEPRIPDSWPFFYRHLAGRIVGLRTRQQELLDALLDLERLGLPMIPLAHLDAAGKMRPLHVCEPFTFFSVFNRQVIPEKRLRIFTELGRRFLPGTPLPSQLPPVPAISHVRPWFFRDPASPGGTPAALLWDLAEAAMEGVSAAIPALERCLADDGAEFHRLTAGLFWLDPHLFLPADRRLRRHLEQFGITGPENTARGYREWLQRIEHRTHVPFFSLYMHAHQEDGREAGNTWLLTSSRHPDEQRCLAEGFVALDAGEPSDLDDLRSASMNGDGARSSEGPPPKRQAAWDFLLVLRENDLVFVRQDSGRLSGIARIEGPGILVNDEAGPYLMRPVTWLKCGGWRFPEHLSCSPGPLVSLSRFPQLTSSLLDAMGLSQPELENPDRRIWWAHTSAGTSGFDRCETGSDLFLKPLDSHGRPLTHPGHFLDMTPGDLVIGYTGAPTHAVTGLGQVVSPLTQTPSGPNVRVRKTRSVERPLSRAELAMHPGFAASSLLQQSPHSLSRVTESEYRLIQTLLAAPPARADEYTLADCTSDSFLDAGRITGILDYWRHRKNLVLQGPPGVGKSHLARRLAWLLLGQRADDRIRIVQFHPSYTFLDFIHGPGGSQNPDQRLAGPFLQLCRLARQDEQHDYVLIIEEINRGSPEHIFGELLQMIDPDHRHPDHALALSFADPCEPDFYVPPRLHMIGTMNAAEPARGLTDLSFRRRFAFVHLEPCFDAPAYRNHLRNAGMPADLVETLCSRMSALNGRIAAEAGHLGPGYRIGHSYFMPPDQPVTSWNGWYAEVVQTQIRPLLECYWPHEPARIERETAHLLSGI
ncbi:MAG TPA: AAA family ATPase [Candidatus Ozemobacteraceae bacterium]|nr:AAA family ATPase [Candidatus Ozemobacteraceae bacterium]